MSTRLLITPYASMSFSAVGSTHALIVAVTERGSTMKTAPRPKV